MKFHHSIASDTNLGHEWTTKPSKYSDKSGTQIMAPINDLDKAGVKSEILVKMTERDVENCYECQLTTKQHRQAPVKMTQIPEKTREVVSVDFGGPYPDGHYNIVVIDKRTRYPEVR